MTERYDLKKMLEEIKEDEKLRHLPKKAEASQDEIKKLLAKKRRGKKT